MTIVLFNQVDDFLEELERDVAGEGVERNVVRCTFETQPFGQSGVRVLQVVATYRPGRDVFAGPTVRLAAYAGQLWGIARTDDETTARADRIAAAIKEKAESSGLELRGGVLAEVEA